MESKWATQALSQGRVTPDMKWIDIKIKDLRGSIIKSIPKTLLHNSYYIDLSNFSSGVYFLEVLFNSSNKQVYKIQKFN